jgi:flagellar basal body-associated protein FliL
MNTNDILVFLFCATGSGVIGFFLGSKAAVAYARVQGAKAALRLTSAALSQIVVDLTQNNSDDAVAAALGPHVKKHDMKKGARRAVKETAKTLQAAAEHLITNINRGAFEAVRDFSKQRPDEEDSPEAA